MDRRAFFLALVLGSQALLPAHYYLGTDPLDERFAWRMFSPVRMLTCQVEYEVQGVPVALPEHFHSAWITLVKRGRLDVTEAVGQRSEHADVHAQQLADPPHVGARLLRQIGKVPHF